MKKIIEQIVRLTVDGDETKAEVVGEIVRCKDCRFGLRCFDVRNEGTDSWVDCTDPDGLNRDVSDDGYCSAGIRRKVDGKETEDEQIR